LPEVRSRAASRDAAGGAPPHVVIQRVRSSAPRDVTSGGAVYTVVWRVPLTARMSPGSPRAAGSHAGECHSCVTNHRIVKEAPIPGLCRRSFPGLARGRGRVVTAPPRGQAGAVDNIRQDKEDHRPAVGSGSRGIGEQGRSRSCGSRPQRNGGSDPRRAGEGRTTIPSTSRRVNPRGEPAYDSRGERGWCRRGLIDTEVSQAGFPRRSLERR
jgi:hypothetical protein